MVSPSQLLKWGIHVFWPTVCRRHCITLQESGCILPILEGFSALPKGSGPMLLPLWNSKHKPETLCIDRKLLIKPLIECLPKLNYSWIERDCPSCYMTGLDSSFVKSKTFSNYVTPAYFIHCNLRHLHQKTLRTAEKSEFKNLLAQWTRNTPSIIWS